LDRGAFAKTCRRGGGRLSPKARACLPALPASRGVPATLGFEIAPMNARPSRNRTSPARKCPGQQGRPGPVKIHQHSAGAVALLRLPGFPGSLALLTGLSLLAV